MDSKAFRNLSEEAELGENCPHSTQKLHFLALAQLMEGQEEANKTLGSLVSKINDYETINLLNGEHNDDPFQMPRKTYVQRMYDGTKKIEKLENSFILLNKDFTNHKAKTFGKDIGKFSTFVNNIILPIAVLISILLGIYSFVNNRSDFHRSDNLQKKIENTEKQNK